MGQIVITWTSVGTVHKVAYIKLFSANFDPLPLLHFVTHHGTPKVRHTSRTPPPILVGLVQETWTKALCTNSLSIVRGGFCPGGLSGGLLSGRFCPGWFCLFPLLLEYICYNRKLNITLNFMFHMYDKKFISVTQHAFDPPPVTNCHSFSDASSVTYFMNGPVVADKLLKV